MADTYIELCPNCNERHIIVVEVWKKEKVMIAKHECMWCGYTLKEEEIEIIDSELDEYDEWN